MNDLKYVEEKIEDLFPSSSSDEANNAIKEWITAKRGKETQKRIGNSINKTMWDFGI